MGGKPEREQTIRELVQGLKEIPKSWTVGHSNKWDPEKKPSDYAHLMSALETPPHLDLAEKTTPRKLQDSDLPANFDPRDTWGDMCPSLLEIRDQGSCGSCWAFGGSEAFTDRSCIQSNGAHTIDLSAEDVLSCCRTCGFGCNGGYLGATWSYMTGGVCTGGLYDGTGCKPYSIAPCEHHTTGDRPDCADVPDSATPACTNTCVTDYNTNPYASDKIN